MEKQNEVQKHINEKFINFANRNRISIIGFPSPHDVKILKSSNKSSTQHMAVKAVKNGQYGYIVNVADERLNFFTDREVICHPVKEGGRIKDITKGEERRCSFISK